MEQEQKYYDLIVKVNNHEKINLSDDSSNSDDSVDKIKEEFKEDYKDELDITEHTRRQLPPIMETTDTPPSKEIDAL